MSSLANNPLAEAIVETPRLLLRRFKPADSDVVFEMFSDAYAQRFYPEMRSVENAAEWIRWNERNYEEYGFGLWAVTMKQDGTFVGDCGLTYQETDEGRHLEIGYHTLAEYRGRGFATEAARACLVIAFGAVECDDVVSIVHPDNVASNLVASRVHAGMRHVNQRGKRRNLYFTERGGPERSISIERTRTN